MTGRFVLKNGNKIVRVINFGSSPKLTAIVTEDQRIEFVPSMKQANESFENYTVVETFSKAQVKKSSLELKNGLTLEYDPQSTLTQTSEQVPGDEIETYKDTLKWSGIGHVAAIFLLLIVGYFLQPDKIKDIKVVKVIKQNRPVIKKIKNTKVAKVRKSTFKNNRKARISDKNKKGRKVVKRTKRKTIMRKKAFVASKKARTRGRVRKNSGVRNVSKLGALGALGASNGSTIRGANLRSAGKTGGHGAARFAGNGVNQKSLYGKGLVQVSNGNGVKVGRYKAGSGTRGIGGGGSAGYGKNNIHAGGGSGFVVPMYEEALVHGGLSREQIETVIKRNEGQIRYCYEKGLQTNPGLSGTVGVNFVINGLGKVSAAKLGSSSLRSKRVNNCIVAKLKRWKFPRPVGGLNVKVDYPFKLMKNAEVKLTSME